MFFARPRDIMKVIVRKGGRDHFHMFVIDPDNGQVLYTQAPL